MHVNATGSHKIMNAFICCDVKSDHYIAMILFNFGIVQSVVDSFGYYCLELWLNLRYNIGSNQFVEQGLISVT